MTAKNARYERLRHRLAAVCGAIAVLVGFLVLLGWIADNSTLKSVLPGLATMKANTAVLFVLAGASLCGFATGRLAARVRAAGLLCAGAVVVVAALTLTQYAFAIDLGIDQLLFRDAPNAVATSSPGGMAPVTATVFLLIGMALLLRQTGHLALTAEILAGLALLVSALCCLSYLYGASSLQSVAPFASVAVQTAVALAILCTGLLSTSPAKGVVGVLASDGVGGALARRMLPAAVVVPVLIGWLRLAGQRAGYYDTEFGLALLMLTSVTFFIGLVIWSAVQVQRFADDRARADEAVRESRLRYELAIAGSNDGIWDWDILRDSSFYSDRCLELWGYRPGGAAQAFEPWARRMHPDDRERVLAAVRRHTTERVPYDV